MEGRAKRPRSGHLVNVNAAVDRLRLLGGMNFAEPAVADPLENEVWAHLVGLRDSPRSRRGAHPTCGAGLLFTLDHAGRVTVAGGRTLASDADSPLRLV